MFRQNCFHIWWAIYAAWRQLFPPMTTICVVHMESASIHALVEKASGSLLVRLSVRDSTWMSAMPVHSAKCQKGTHESDTFDFICRCLTLTSARSRHLVEWSPRLIIYKDVGSPSNECSLVVFTSWAGLVCYWTAVIVCLNRIGSRQLFHRCALLFPRSVQGPRNNSQDPCLFLPDLPLVHFRSVWIGLWNVTVGGRQVVIVKTTSAWSRLQIFHITVSS